MKMPAGYYYFFLTIKKLIKVNMEMIDFLKIKKMITIQVASK